MAKLERTLLSRDKEIKRLKGENAKIAACQEEVERKEDVIRRLQTKVSEFNGRYEAVRTSFEASIEVLKVLKEECEQVYKRKFIARYRAAMSLVTKVYNTTFK